MESEMNSIRTNETWDLVELPENRKALPCKWVFRLKQVSDSSDPKYKARIVAKGFRQEHGVDFDEIFRPSSSCQPFVSSSAPSRTRIWSFFNWM
jgi:hypothetical protein